MKKKYFLIFSISLFSNYIFTKDIYKNYTKEALKKEASFVYIVQKDSILELEYSKARKLFLTEETIKALKKALNLDKTLSFNKNQNELNYKNNFLIAEIYNRIGNTRESLKYYQKSINILGSNKFLDNNKSLFENVEIVKTYHRIGSSFQKLSLSDSLQHFKDSAKVFYNRVENFPSLNNEISLIKARSFSNLSGLYEADSVFSSAEKYANKSIEIHKKLNNKLGLASAMNNLGNIYLSQEKYENSKKIYFEAIELIKNYDSPKAIDRKASLYYNLAWAMRKLKEFEAYDNLEIAQEFTDKIRDDNIKKVVEQIRLENDVEKAREEEVKKRLIREQKFWIFAVISLLIIFSLAFYLFLYKQRKKTLALKLANIDYEQKQKIDAVKSESQTRVLNATIDGKETERKEIAETLHDNVSALLSSANLHLQASRKYFNGNIPIEFFKSEQIINEASEKIRDLSHNLVSSLLLKFGLTFAVKDILDKYSNSTLHIVADIEKLRRYNQKFEIKTFNIIQEFLNNILKHSQAKNAKVKMKEENGILLIRVSDDGVGFDKTKINLKDGLGINQIDARIKMMKGHFLIDSKEGFGTKIKVDLPIQERETSISA